MTGLLEHRSTDGAFDRKLLAPMMLGAILNPINSSIIAVSLIPIGRAFGAPPGQTAWLVSALYLATAIGQPVVGRLVDVLGPRVLFLVGSALGGLAGVLGTVAPDLPVLVVARVILGFGTCAGYPAAMYLIRREAERTGQDSPGGVLTALAVASQTTAAVGPTLGGLLIGLGGWRATFAINIPLALLSLWLGARRLPRTTADERTKHGRDVFDLPGIGVFAAMLVSLLLYLMTPRVDDLWLLAITLVAGGAFVVRETRAAHPFIDVRVLGGNAPLVRTYVRTFLAQLTSYCFLYGFTQWLEGGRALSAGVAGLILLPTFGMGIAVSTLTGRHPQIRGKLLVAAVAQIALAAVLLLVGGGTAVWLLVGVALLTGIPQGINNLANQNAVYYQADPATIAAGAGLLRTFVYVGAIAASAANGGFLGADAGTTGLHHLAWFMVGAGALFLLVTAADRALGHVVPQSSSRSSSGPKDDAPTSTRSTQEVSA